MEVSMNSRDSEIQKMKSTLKPDVFEHAQKSILLEKKDGIAFLVFDTLNSKANILSTPNLMRIYDVLVEVEKDKSLEALVLISRKPSIFIAGADISEIKRLKNESDPKSFLMKVHSIFNFLEDLKIPTIAAIHGACMGGGTELSLSCDYRIATDARETRIGLPEVQLGIIPGWAGTQRMPALLGLEKSLDLVLTGRAIDAKAAKKIGLVDAVVPVELLGEKAFAFAKEKARTKQKRKSKPKDIKEKLLESFPGKLLIFDQAKKKLVEKTKGHYPAPLKALEVIRKTYGHSGRDGQRIEAEAFCELIKTPECENLINIYYLNEKVKKDKGSSATPQNVEMAAVLGAGIMGGGIAQAFAAKNIRVRMKDINFDSVTKGYQAAYKVFKKQVDRRKMKPNELDNKMGLIEGTVHYAGFKNIDLVVEAVVEDVGIKQKVFQELETKVNEKTVLATNTSSLSLKEIGKTMKAPERLVGMHFFNPVDKMPLVEVIHTEQTSQEAIATIFAVSKKLGKTPILVKDGPGFVVNRILAPYLIESIFMLMEGLKPSYIDSVFEEFGMPMGPCELIDEIGVDTSIKVLKVLYGAFGERMKSPSGIEAAVNEKRYGKKNGKGIYLYEKGSKKKTEDPIFLAKLSKTSSTLDKETIKKRLLFLMVNEAARVLDEKLVREVSDIDVGMIFGTGFAPFRGGLLRYADSVGADQIVADLEIFTRNYGEKYKPCAYLQEMAVSKQTFYPKE